MATRNDYGNGTRAVIYARYSSDNQREESIVAQVRACREYAESRGLTVVETYTDEAISGKDSSTKKRQQYQRMLRAADAGKFEYILIHKYDRIARSTIEHVTLAQRLAKCNIELIATAQDYGNTKEAKMMKGITWLMSEYYVDNLAEETRKGHKETALQAKHNGGVPPFGYDVEDQRYVINELEAPFVRRMFQACIEGTGFTDIINDLKNAGIVGKRGRPIAYPSIYEILRNEKYTGVYTYSITENENRDDRRTKKGAIRIENALPALVGHETWEGVQKIMQSRKNVGRAERRKYLLSGLVQCECGATMHGITTKKIKNGRSHVYSYYYCSKKCGSKRIRTDELDSKAISFLKELAKPENQRSFEDAVVKYRAQMKAAAMPDKEYLKQEIRDRENQVNALVTNMSAATLPVVAIEEMGNKIADLRQQIGLMQAEMDKPLTFSKKQINEYFDMLRGLDNQSDEQRRKTVNSYIEKIYIKTNDVEIKSSLASFVRNIGCGEAIPIIPQHLLNMYYKRG